METFILFKNKFRTFIYIAVILLILLASGFFVYNNFFSPQAKALSKINHIIYLIKNPDPKLISKYKVNPKQLKDDQAIIICGGYHDTQEKIEDKNCSTTSLYGLKKIIKKSDPAAAQALIKNTIFPAIRNASFGDVGEKQFTLEDALKIDPKKLFLKFLPRGQSYVGSQVKQEAALETIQLYYFLQPSSGK